MKLEMSLKKNVVGDLKIWKYFRTRFAGTRPPRLLVSPDSHWLQRQKFLVILMGPKNAKNLGCEFGCFFLFAGLVKTAIRTHK